jgi:ATP-binding protein involved in chromosome partitioning
VTIEIMDSVIVPERIEVADRRQVILTWPDGATFEMTAAQLRGACQCAECREESGRRATERVLNGPAAVTIEDARLVGGYAINFVFGPDRHATGIFPFAALRRLADSGQ